MLLSISSQPIAGGYQSTKGRRIEKIPWREEEKAVSAWFPVLEYKKGDEVLLVSNNEEVYLIGEDEKEILITEIIKEEWQTDLIKPVTVWI